MHVEHAYIHQIFILYNVYWGTYEKIISYDRRLRYLCRVCVSATHEWWRDGFSITNSGRASTNHDPTTNHLDECGVANCYKDNTNVAYKDRILTTACDDTNQ